MSLLGRSFLKELDFTADEWRSLLELSGELKAARRERREEQRLVGKQVALLFEKTSTRTRCAFEVAMADQGGTTTYLDPSGSQIGHKESAADTARVLGRWYDGIEYRGSGQAVVETLAEHAGVPVYNGLTDDWHPTQMLADQLTMMEHAGRPLNEISFAFLGDARNNVGNSLLISGALMGMDVRMIAPTQQQNADGVVAEARRLAEASGARITITDDTDAVEGCDFLYTDVWVSLGEPKEVWAERIDLLRGYQINADLMAKAGPGAKFMHCLPAFHDLNTTVGQDLFSQFGLTGVEVTDEVFESPASVVFDQAENRMHTIKAVLVATLAG
ncbi:ornithine carbamoyltransferase [Tessaracoccus sp. MC1865]|uniref:ornithine carbamoyltransferase n=1 Tax=Tessaracoccus sp. MC1865 TaxID=2760310 RepID=UPI001603FBA0|nr:ornithine carbamoyltransferase [Tessaracoccus sp. MC1865]MBB1482856.1 ornithine carbamoyltransferase [Tessaracoccus sp. MC1865]QTO37706.1 ornithine carbamoyltransferase [Tessaracoccus sp. MC1865]